MSTYNEYAGIIPIQPGTPKETVLGAICAAIGAPDQECYFPLHEIIGLTDDGREVTGIDFGFIPPEGAHADMIERAMVALAPFVECEEFVQFVPGANWQDAKIYRFIHGRVEIADAVLTSDGVWNLVQPDPPQFHITRAHADVATTITTRPARAEETP